MLPRTAECDIEPNTYRTVGGREQRSLRPWWSIDLRKDPTNLGYLILPSTISIVSFGLVYYIHTQSLPASLSLPETEINVLQLFLVSLSGLAFSAASLTQL